MSAKDELKRIIEKADKKQLEMIIVNLQKILSV